MSDVFLSYKAEDRRRVRPLVEALQADGFSVWWDEQIGGGAAWRHAIETELNAAKCVIVAWSKRSVGADGTFVQDEATRAQQRHVYVPVTIDKVHLPLGFGETQVLPLTGWHGDRADPRYQAVLAAVQRNAGAKRRRAPAAAARPGIDRRTVVVGGGVAAAAAAGVGAWALLKPTSAGASNSIAVLPFANLSGDPAQAYFLDGIAEEIRSALGRIAGLKVVGRTSSEAVRNDDATSAASKLAVYNILTGSVRQSPSTIRVNAELIDGKTGLDKWSQDYDRAPGDAIKIQTDIAEHVATALSATLATVARKAITVGGTSNVEAQKLVLRGTELEAKGSKATSEEARSLFQRALELDPNYADAYARQALTVRRLADTYATSGDQFGSGLAGALRFANEAISLAPTLETGYRARATIYESALKLQPALSDYQRALKLAPGNPGAVRDYADFMSLLGNSDRAVQLAKDAIATDPLNPNSYGQYVGALANAGRFSEAITESERVRRDSPELFTWTRFFGILLMQVGRLDEAARFLAEGEQDHPSSWPLSRSSACGSIRPR
jgi:serine/threonine-protein kinase